MERTVSTLNLPSKVNELIHQVDQTPGYHAARLGIDTHIMIFTGPDQTEWQTSIMLGEFTSGLGHVNLRNKLKAMIGWTPHLYHQTNMAKRQAEVQDRVRLDAASAGVSVEDLTARMRTHAENEIAKAKNTITRDIVLTTAEAAKYLGIHYGAAQARAAALGLADSLHELPDDVVEALKEGHIFKRQRNLDDRTLRTTVKLMLTSNWRWIPDPIAIATDGFIVNGLSRVTAIFQIPGGSAPLRVITKVPSDIGAFIDNGRPRTVRDALHVYGVKYADIAKTTLDMVLWYDEETTDPLAWLAWTRFTWPIGAVSFEAIKHVELLNKATRFAQKITRRISVVNPRPLISTSAMAAAYYVLHRDHPLPDDGWSMFLTDVALKTDHRLHDERGNHVADIAPARTPISDQLHRMLLDYDLPKVVRPGSKTPPLGRHARSVEQFVLFLHTAARVINPEDGHDPLVMTAGTALPYFTDRSSISAYLDGKQ